MVATAGLVVASAYGLVNEAVGIVACGGQPEVTPPTLLGVENPSSATIVCEGETFTFKLDQALADNGGIYLVIEATEGQSNGVSRAHSKAVAIKMVEEPTAAAVDIRADYVAKNGNPNAAAPKFFFLPSFRGAGFFCVFPDVWRG